MHWYFLVVKIWGLYGNITVTEVFHNFGTVISFQLPRLEIQSRKFLRKPNLNEINGTVALKKLLVFFFNCRRLKKIDKKLKVIVSSASNVLY